MGRFRKLTPAQLQSLIIALNTKVAPKPVPAPKPKPVVNGATLYNNRCAGCHGQLASSKVKGATAARINSAIRANRGGMSRFKALTQAQVAAIAKALAGASSSGTGTYGGSCATCHNASGSLKAGAGSMPGVEPEGSDD